MAPDKFGLMVLMCVVMAVTLPVAALDPHKRISQYVQTTWSVADGLPAYGVTAIAQDVDGYLWVGTNHGLARFDGARFRGFDRRNTSALASGDVSALVRDPEGGVWIGTIGGGVVRYHDGRFTAITTQDGLAGDRIVALAIAPDGDLWAGGYEGLTQLRDGKVIRRYGADDGLVGDPVTAVQIDAGGELWVATLGSLHRFRSGRLQPVLPEGAPAPATRDLFLLHDGSLLARSLEGALARRDRAGFEPWRPPGIPDDVAVRSLLEDRDGNLWLGTEQHGLYRIREGRADHYDETDGLPSARVRTLFEDREGNLWVGSPEAGLYRFRDGDFTTWGRPEGFGSDTIFPVIEDHAGNIWAGSNEGLVRLRGDTIQRYTTADGLSSDTIRALHESRSHDTLWVGTANSGLDRMQHGRVTQTLTTDNGLPSNRINALLEDRRGNLWIATAGGGLARLADGRISTYSHADGLADDFVFVLLEVRNGLLLVGTANGLSVIRDDRIVRDAHVPDVAGAVLALHEDTRGSLWIGTEGHGLYRWRHGRLTAYDTVSGFPDDTIYCILEDARGRLWFNSYRGVFSIERAQLDAVAVGGRGHVSADLYGIANGLRSSEGNGGTQPAGWRGRDGRMWFPTMGGVSVVDPARLARRDSALTVQIESMVVDDVAVELAAPIRLPAGSRRLEIRYTAPTLSSAERTGFRVALDGFDATWDHVAQQRVAYFTNLGPGDYRFRVAAGSAASGSDQVTALEFSIAPRFHQAWWFRFLLALTAAAVLWGAYYLRLTWFKARHAVLRERQRIAGEIHDDLAQSLSGIFYQTQAALRRLVGDPDAAARHMQVASDLAAQGAEAARRSVWDLDAHHDHGDGLLQTIVRATRGLARDRDPVLRIHGRGHAWHMPAQIEHQLLRIAQAAIANAVEHAGARTISVRLAYAGRAMSLGVRDDGAGFDPEAVVRSDGRGFGLANMGQRVEAIGGRLEIRSAPDAGTSVHVTMARRPWAWYLRRALAAAFRRQDPRATAEDQNPAG